jgi:hypothetical protein
MMFRIVFWDVLMMEAVRTSETSVDNHFTRQYIPEDNSEQMALGQIFLRVLRLSPVNIIPPWLSAFIYHLGNKK